MDDLEWLIRPCVDCGDKTGNFCVCRAIDRLPREEWAAHLMTPLCTNCEAKHLECHFCRRQLWCIPPTRSSTPVNNTPS